MILIRRRADLINDPRGPLIPIPRAIWLILTYPSKPNIPGFALIGTGNNSSLGIKIGSCARSWKFDCCIIRAKANIWRWPAPQPPEEASEYCHSYPLDRAYSTSILSCRPRTGHDLQWGQASIRSLRTLVALLTTMIHSFVGIGKIRLFYLVGIHCKTGSFQSRFPSASIPSLASIFCAFSFFKSANRAIWREKETAPKNFSWPGLLRAFGLFISNSVSFRFNSIFLDQGFIVFLQIKRIWYSFHIQRSRGRTGTDSALAFYPLHGGRSLRRNTFEISFLCSVSRPAMIIRSASNQGC